MRDLRTIVYLLTGFLARNRVGIRSHIWRMKMDAKTKTRLPEVGEYIRGLGTLVGIQEISPPPPPIENKDYIFEEITARVELRLGSERLQEIATLWDAYGKETSVESAIKEAKTYAAKRNIGPSSDLEVVVIRITEQIRKRPLYNSVYGYHAYDRRITEFKQLPVGWKADLPAPVKTVVWSSRKP